MTPTGFCNGVCGIPRNRVLHIRQALVTGTPQASHGTFLFARRYKLYRTTLLLCAIHLEDNLLVWPWGYFHSRALQLPVQQTCSFRSSVCLPVCLKEGAEKAAKKELKKHQPITATWRRQQMPPNTTNKQKTSTKRNAFTQYRVQ